MNQTGIDLLLDGEPLGGVLRLLCEETVESAAGTIQFVDNQVVVNFTVEPMSRLAATLLLGHVMVLDNQEVAPLRFSQTAIFESRLGSLTLIQLGVAQVLTHTLTHPLECLLRPRFTVLAHVGKPYWRWPTMVMVEVDSLDARWADYQIRLIGLQRKRWRCPRLELGLSRFR